MYQDKIVLCGASAYEQKYYFNQDFSSLPDAVKQELQIMCVLYTEDIGGILTLEFDEEGNLQFKTEALDADAMYDEIGSVLKISSFRAKKMRAFLGNCSGNVLTRVIFSLGKRRRMRKQKINPKIQREKLWILWKTETDLWI